MKIDSWNSVKGCTLITLFIHGTHFHSKFLFNGNFDLFSLNENKPPDTFPSKQLKYLYTCHLNIINVTKFVRPHSKQHEIINVVQLIKQQHAENRTVSYYLDREIVDNSEYPFSMNTRPSHVIIVAYLCSFTHTSTTHHTLSKKI